MLRISRISFVEAEVVHWELFINGFHDFYRIETILIVSTDGQNYQKASLRVKKEAGSGEQ